MESIQSLLEKLTLSPENRKSLADVIAKQLSEAKRRLNKMLNVVYELDMGLFDGRFNAIIRYEEIFFYREAAYLYADASVLLDDKEASLVFCIDKMKDLGGVYVEDNAEKAYHGDTKSEFFMGKTFLDRVVEEHTGKTAEKPHIIRLKDDETESVISHCKHLMGDDSISNISIDRYFTNPNYYIKLSDILRLCFTDQAKRDELELTRIKDVLKTHDKVTSFLQEKSEDEILSLPFAVRVAKSMMDDGIIEEGKRNMDFQREVYKEQIKYFSHLAAYSIDLANCISLLGHLFSPFMSDEKILSAVRLDDTNINDFMDALNKINLDRIQAHIPDYQIKREISSGIWGVVFQTEHAGHNYVLKVPRRDIDLSIKGHKKIVDHFGQGNLDVALDNLMKTEAEVTAFLSDEEND
ncbi:MAG: hypothetical protein KKE20_05685, partial [Nanoarchaeota archaeon]|nr:hypothetical protein [Nanoarchaeota archaeon]